MEQLEKTKDSGGRQEIGEKGNQEPRVKSQETRHKNQEGWKPTTSSAELVEGQLSFFQLNDPVLENIKEELQKTDINTLTPVEALMKLNEIKRMLSKK